MARHDEIELDLTDPAWTFFDQPPRLMWPGGGPPTERPGRVGAADLDRARHVAHGDVVLCSPNSSVLALVASQSPWIAGMVQSGWSRVG